MEQGKTGYFRKDLFTRYVRGLIQSIRACRVGCNVAGLPLNIVAYADDMVLLVAPSWHAIQESLYYG